MVKENQKAFVVKENKESQKKQFNPKKDIDYYNSNAYNKKEDHLFDDEPNTNYT